MKTFQHLIDEPAHLVVFNVPLEYFLHDCVVDTCEEFLDVAFEDIACSRVILRDLPSEVREAIKRPMRAFVFSARIGIKNKARIKVPIQLFVNQMMQHSVAHDRFVYIARFRIGNIKRRVSGVFIGSVLKKRMQF